MQQPITHLRQSRRGGFTLVEMLVSVALVLLIMTLFAQAFGIAAGSIRTARGVAENDQRARSLVTILLGDLRKRTYRQRDDAVTETIVAGADAAPVKQQLIALQNLANRNSLGIVPLHPDYYNGGNSGKSQRLVDTAMEKGYFYYSEGDPTNDTDDVLQFTVDMTQIDLGNEDTTPLIGRARRINTPDPVSGSMATWAPQPPSGVPGPNNPDQPIWDDGNGFQLNAANAPYSYAAGDTGASQSRYAEISYFMRDGKLYHRVMLIRDPLSYMTDADKGLGQPQTGPTGGGASSINMMNGVYDSEDGSPTAISTTDFWNDFDFSAVFYPPGAGGNPTLNVYFAEIASLDNTSAGENDAPGGGLPVRYFALGNPQNRFGHDSLPRTLQGRPKEHYDPTSAATFFGRYTQEETSHPQFVYPGAPSYADNTGSLVGASPMAPAALPGIADTNNDGVADSFTGGPRRGEDILLSNCHAFDVKIWDDQLRAFVDIGHTLPPTPNSATNPRGDYHTKQVLDNSIPWNPVPPSPGGSASPGRFQAAFRGMARYGSLNGQSNRVFDTWHPAFDFDTTREGLPGTGPANTGTGPADDPPPYRPLWSERDSFTLPIVNGGAGGGAPYGTGPYLNGAQVNPTLYNPLHTNSMGGPGYDIGDRVFPRPDQNDPFHGHQSYFYIFERTTNGASTGATQAQLSGPATNDPNWPESPGATVQDGQIIWKAIPNTIGLKAMQISVRFYDPTSGQIRQLTITHSFVEL